MFSFSSSTSRCIVTRNFIGTIPNVLPRKLEEKPTPSRRRFVFARTLRGIAFPRLCYPHWLSPPIPSCNAVFASGNGTHQVGVGWKHWTARSGAPVLSTRENPQLSLQPRNLCIDYFDEWLAATLSTLNVPFTFVRLLPESSVMYFEAEIGKLLITNLRASDKPIIVNKTRRRVVIIEVSVALLPSYSTFNSHQKRNRHKPRYFCHTPDRRIRVLFIRYSKICYLTT